MSEEAIKEVINRVVDEHIEGLRYSRVGDTKYTRKTLGEEGIRGSIRLIEFLRRRFLEAIAVIERGEVAGNNAVPPIEYEATLLNNKINLLAQLAVSNGADPVRVTAILNHETIEIELGDKDVVRN